MGSNLGNRRLNLSRAMNRISREFGPYELSHVVETPAWGYVSGNDYLNVCMMFASDLEPEEILHKLQSIEHELSPDPHRTPEGNYADRLLDIDIIAIDEKRIDTPELHVPHPRLPQRRFFLEPLAETAPEWRHPDTGLTAAEMLAALH